MTKLPKKAVRYGPGHEGSKCGVCKYFLKPSGCKWVEGKISPEDWCELFQKAPK